MEKKKYQRDAHLMMSFCWTTVNCWGLIVQPAKGMPLLNHSLPFAQANLFVTLTVYSVSIIPRFVNVANYRGTPDNHNNYNNLNDNKLLHTISGCTFFFLFSLLKRSRTCSEITIRLNIFPSQFYDMLFPRLHFPRLNLLILTYHGKWKNNLF